MDMFFIHKILILRKGIKWEQLHEFDDISQQLLTVVYYLEV